MHLSRAYALPCFPCLLWIASIATQPSAIAGPTEPPQFTLAQSGENFVYSPYGLETVMGLASAGARGKTSEEIDRAFPMIEKEKFLVASNPGGRFLIETSNSAWIKKDFSLLPEYVKDIKIRFGTEITSLDFNQRESSAKIINSWVSKKTAGKIPSLVSAQNFNDDLRLILLNTVYFNSKWSAPFQVTNTHPEMFQTAEGAPLRVEMMHQELEASVIRGKDFDLLSLPYADGKEDLWLLLPHPGKKLGEVETFQEAQLAERFKLGEFVRKKVKLSLPRFKIESNFDLIPELKARGVQNLFSRQLADLSGISSEKPLFISSVIQRAVIEVDEVGTVAAAATMMGFAAGGMLQKPPELEKIELRFNRPFAYFLRHHESGRILFMGRVNRPPAAADRK